MISSSSNTSFPFASDRALLWTLRSLAMVSGLVVVLITLFVLKEVLPLTQTIAPTRFFTDASWNPIEGAFNFVPMLVGSLVVMAGAVLVAAPLGVACSIFCVFYAPRPLAQLLHKVVELLAGIPSVVYGFWGLVVLVPLINRLHAPGTSLLAGILVLAIMILPMMSLVASNVLAKTPASYLQGAAALGLTRWGTIWGVVLPSARPGLITGAVLQAGRALGETMAVLMVCGNVVAMPKGLFDPMRTLTANIALEMAYAMGDHRRALFANGLALLVMVLALLACAELSGSTRRSGSWRTHVRD